MRTEKAFKSMAISSAVQLAVFLLMFINRRMFLQFLNEELLGVQGLLGNIFTILLAADFGMANVLSFHFYRELAQKNYPALCKLMKIYKIYNYIIAGVLIVGGCAAYPFLPMLIGETTVPISTIRSVYFLYLGSVAATYLFNYPSIMWGADQKAYLADRYYLITKVLSAVLQFFALWVWKSFFLYVAMNLLGTLINCILLFIRVRREYPAVFLPVKISRKDVADYHLGSDSKNFFFHKLAGVVYSGTDSIVITAFCGLAVAGLYSNYFLIYSQVQQLIAVQLMAPVRAAVGNMIYTEKDHAHIVRIFRMLEMGMLLLALVVSTCYLTIFQPFITCWIGAEYQLSLGFVYLLSATAGFTLIGENLYTFRCSYGEFKADRNAMILSAIINLVVSVALAPFLGLIGVQIGTILGNFPIVWARGRFVFNHLKFNNFGSFMLKKALSMLLLLAESAFIFFITRNLPYTYLGIAARGIISLVAILAINSLLFWKTDSFQDLVRYGWRLAKAVGHKIRTTLTKK